MPNPSSRINRAAHGPVISTTTRTNTVAVKRSSSSSTTTTGLRQSAGIVHKCIYFSKSYVLPLFVLLTVYRPFESFQVVFVFPSLLTQYEGSCKSAEANIDKDYLGQVRAQRLLADNWESTKMEACHGGGTRTFSPRTASNLRSFNASLSFISSQLKQICAK